MIEEINPDHFPSKDQEKKPSIFELDPKNIFSSKGMFNEQTYSKTHLFNDSRVVNRDPGCVLRYQHNPRSARWTDSHAGAMLRVPFPFPGNIDAQNRRPMDGVSGTDGGARSATQYPGAANADRLPGCQLQVNTRE